MKRKRILLFLMMLSIELIGNQLYAQTDEYSGSSIRTGIGLGANDGHWETGLGLLYSVGYQKSIGKKDRIRINPNLLIGGFRPIGVSDTKDQFYQLSSLGCNLHYDLMKFKATSIVTSVGMFGNYSRGLIGTGGFSETNNSQSRYFHHFYFGGNFSLGLRIAPKNKRLAFELRPLNIQLGNNDFLLGYLMFGVDIKLKK